VSSVYNVNRQINKPIEFKGLKAQYIGYLAGGLVVLLLLFAVLYVAGVQVYLCIAIIGALGFGLFSMVYRYSHKYGAYGLMKAAAWRSLPPALIARSRKKIFDIMQQGQETIST